MRIGDAEREETARALREHCAAGRLCTEVSAFGRAPRAVRKAFATLED